MRLYEFEIVAAGSPELTDDLADLLHEVGAADCTPSACNRVMSIYFGRDAESFEEAVRSAIAHMQAAGLIAARVMVEAADLVPSI